MSYRKQSSKRKRRRAAVPVLGAAGLSLSLASGASGAPAANMSARNFDTNHEIVLAEEEVSDVSLATFYVFDKENSATFRPGLQLVRGGGGCGGGGGGCRGCGGCGGGGCRGCGGCGGGGCRGCAGFGGCGGFGGCAGYGFWRMRRMRRLVGRFGCAGGCCISWGGCRYC
jgi:hypothetical protein